MVSEGILKHIIGPPWATSVFQSTLSFLTTAIQIGQIQVVGPSHIVVAP